MVFKLYISACTGNAKVKKEQSHVKSLLESKGHTVEEVDISDPGKTDEKEFLREKFGNCMVPQLFKDDEHLGNYEAFFNAVEDDLLDEFLKIATPKQTSVSQCQVQDETPVEEPSAESAAEPVAESAPEAATEESTELTTEEGAGDAEEN